jgi:cytochrome c oxidase cbb3-type subunit 3
MKLNSNNTKKMLLSLVALISSTIMKAEATAPAPVAATNNSVWFNGSFILMLCTILILMCVLFIVGKIVKTLIEEDMLETARKNKSSKGLMMMLALTMLTLTSRAQDAAAAAPVVNNGPSMVFGMESIVFWSMLTVLVFEFIAIMVICYVLYVFLLRKGLVKPLFEKVNLPKWLQWNAMMGNDIPLEKDEELLTDHDYDGIQELDNGMPPFLKYLFIITIIFAAYYLVDYHVLKTSPLQMEEYQTEIEKGEEAKLEYLKIAGASVDENTVTLSEDGGVLANGAKIYATNCVACHGDKGQGGVGPNLTDNYWLHGGTINNVFKTIKSGVPEKGMRAWESEIKPADIQAVSSYILKNLTGTNVAGGKAPQGELAGASAPSPSADSTKTTTVDSTMATKP